MGLLAQWPHLLLSGAILASAPWAAVAAMRCGTDLVQEGQRSFEVTERCGEPDYAVNYPLRDWTGQPTAGGLQHWYYDPGPYGLIHKLVFHNEVLVSEQTLGRGFREHAGGRCQPAVLRRGLSEYELLAHCGEPIASRLLWRGYPQHGEQYLGLGGVFAPVKEWVYEFGRGQFRRAVVLENGLISSVEVLDKPR